MDTRLRSMRPIEVLRKRPYGATNGNGETMERRACVDDLNVNELAVKLHNRIARGLLTAFPKHATALASCDYSIASDATARLQISNTFFNMTPVAFFIECGSPMMLRRIVAGTLICGEYNLTVGSDGLLLFLDVRAILGVGVSAYCDLYNPGKSSVQGCRVTMFGVRPDQADMLQI